ncbi:MAG: DUF262 domain-containing protein [Lachnospiraceae bacterium]|jgi:hypothetical protein|nr:DUF262 domain-containing protein [Lachnospiraceae bacterium]
MQIRKKIKRDEVEEEQLYFGTYEKEIIEPFNPKDVDIVSQPMVISNVIDQLKYGDILLEPDFQRHPDLWEPQQQSRLIESLIIRIPLPTFYFDSTEDDKLIVVDGLQRLYSIKRFMVLDINDPDRLKLTGLEYLKEYEGNKFEDLPPSIQRRIKTQSLTAYIIRPGTPDKVRTSIFTRINTGGLTLEPAEIKNSVYRGQAANLLKELAHSNEFVKATRNKIDTLRMLDCEFVNRFLAFYLLGIEKYPGNLESYLNDVMIRLQKESKTTIEKCRIDFLKAMKYTVEIFGDTAFRKINVNEKYGQINKPLYDAVSVNLAKLSVEDCEKLLREKDKLMIKYTALLRDKKFVDIITNGTAAIHNVEGRHSAIHKIFQEVLVND